MQKWNNERDGEKSIDKMLKDVILCIRGFPKPMGSRAPYSHRKHCNITMSHFPQCTLEGWDGTTLVKGLGSSATNCLPILIYRESWSTSFFVCFFFTANLHCIGKRGVTSVTPPPPHPISVNFVQTLRRRKGTQKLPRGRVNCKGTV